MPGPAVVDGHLVFTVADPDDRFVEVELSCDDAVVDRHRFRRGSHGWLLAVPVPPVLRLEYRLVVTRADGTQEVVLDPANPRRVATAFGDRSVAVLPGYSPPAWLDAAAVPARRSHLHAATVVGDVPVVLWRPGDLDDDDPAPLLVVHDGPEYDRLAQLGHWAGTAIARAALPPFRLALLQPLARDDWYGANPEWPRAVRQAVGAVAGRIATTGPLAIMGASLGGLASLQAALAWPDPPHRSGVGAVFSQSGSFFRPRLDPQESGYPHFDRITELVATMAGLAAGHGQRLRVGMTCGQPEENHANNLRMARDLRDAGHAVTFTSLPDLHNYTAWRDGLEPTLGDLLATTWADVRSTVPLPPTPPGDLEVA